MNKKAGIVLGLGLGLAAGVTAFALARNKGQAEEGGALSIKMYDADTGLELPRVTGITTGALPAYSIKPGQSAQVSVKVTNLTTEGPTGVPAFFRVTVAGEQVGFPMKEEDEYFTAGQAITFNYMYTAPNQPGLQGDIWAFVQPLVDGVAQADIARASQPVVIGYNIVYKATVEFV